MRLKTVVALLAAAIAGRYIYGRLAGGWLRNWGARPYEVDMTLPGDDILPGATLQTTRAITVDTGPEHIWPWLLQMGPRPRAGVYTYDWIERLLGIDIDYFGKKRSRSKPSAGPFERPGQGDLKLKVW